LSKYSNFERKPRDAYFTPEKAFLPLVPHLPVSTFTFAEPCAGDGRLVQHIEKHTKGVCTFASDIEPQKDWIASRDVFELTSGLAKNPQLMITNPPYEKDLLLAMIPYLTNIAPTWLLLRSDFLFNKYAGQFRHTLTKVVAIGRVSWEENGVSGKENHAWMLFSNLKQGPTQFFGRTS
jgi:hypothetical protein